MKLTLSEQYVQKLFQTKYGILLQKIIEIDGVKTPDFEFLTGNKRIFVCELKDFEHVEPSEEAGWSVTNHPDGSVEASKASNAPNRISQQIYKAYQQLSKYSEPKVLIFLNHSGMDYRDLEETYRGYFIIEYGDKKIKKTYSMRASEGRIKNFKSKIDLYIWIDVSALESELQDDKIVFLFVSETGQKIAMEHFGIKIDVV